MELDTPHGHCERILVNGKTWRCPDNAHALLVEVEVDGCRNYPRTASQNPLHCLAPGETVTIEDIDETIQDIKLVIDVYDHAEIVIADCLNFDRKSCKAVKRAALNEQKQ